MIIALLVFIFLREVMFQFSMHKMTNKLMSKNYAEYQRVVDQAEMTELRLKKEKESRNQEELTDQNFAILNDLF